MPPKEYIPVDDNWFEKIYRELNIVPSSKPHKPLYDHNRYKPYKIKLSGYNFISLFNLINIFLLLDYCYGIRGAVEVEISELTYDGDDRFDVDIFNEIRSSKDIDNLPDDHYYFKWEKFYNFLSFCHNFGLFDSFSGQREHGSVRFTKLNSSLLKKLFPYSSTRKKGTKVLPLTIFNELNDLYIFRKESDIKNWIEWLPATIKNSPIFLDGEFARVFGYQLGMNIFQHSGNEYCGDSSALGILSMRILQNKSVNFLKQFYPKNIVNVFSNRNFKGYLEICIGDRGAGIFNTLKETHKKYRIKYGHKGKSDPIHVIAFAFSEFGSSKPKEERWGGVHALHRILKCTEKYGGVIRVRSGGYELIYNTAIANSYKKGNEGLGVYPKPDYIRPVLHPFGTQFQIILPLVTPSVRVNNYVFIDNTDANKLIHKDQYRIVSAAAYFRENMSFFEDDTKAELISLSNNLIEEPLYKTIVYNFGDNENWSEEDVVMFLYSQKSVLHTHKCLLVNIDEGLLNTLKERESLDPDQNEFDTNEFSANFFSVLSVKHRLLPVLDKGLNLRWLGLGRNSHIEMCFNIVSESKSSLSCYSMLKNSGISVSKNNKEVLHHFLSANCDLYFSNSINNNTSYWKCRLNREFISAVYNSIVSSNLNEILKNLHCIKDDQNLYKLPASLLYTDKFVQTTSLFQNELMASQISEAYASVIKNLCHGVKKINLFCATAPAELFSLNIAQKLNSIDCNILNLGHFSLLDEEKLITKEDVDQPSFVITDIVDRGSTITKILKILERNDVKVLCILGLIRFFDDTSINSVEVVMKWDPVNPLKEKIENETVPIFFMAEMSRPNSYDEDDALQIRNPKQLFYIEPFSLEEYSMASLSGQKFANTTKEINNKLKLLLMEKAEVLRTGHWVYGTHHFKVTTCVKKLLSNDEISGEICNDINLICKNNNIDLILLPLHSHISYLIPRLKTALRLSIGKEIKHIFCVSTKILGKKSFYVLPKMVKDMIEHTGNKYKNSSYRLRFMIIDDAIASGRTLETIMRAIIRKSRSVYNQYKMDRSPVDLVYTYTILDRQGRARGTTISSIDNLNLEGDDEWQSYNDLNPHIRYKYNRWIDIDMPVDERNGCGSCKELSELISLKNSLNLPDDHSLSLILNSQIKNLTPRSTETDQFLSYEQKYLPFPLPIGKLEKVYTVELFLLEFYNLMHRGYPFSYLIKHFTDIKKYLEINNRKEYNNKNLEFLVTNIARAFIHEWNYITAEWASKKFIKSLNYDFANGTNIALNILPELGKTLAITSTARKGLRLSFQRAIKGLITLNENDDQNCQKRWNLYEGCQLFCIKYQFYKRHYSISNKDAELKYEEEIVNYIEILLANYKLLPDTRIFLNEIWNSIRFTRFVDPFIPSLLYVLNNIIRPLRHQHVHLLPYGIKRIMSGKYLNERQLSTIIDSFEELKLCMDIVLKRFPNKFSDDSYKIVKILYLYIDKFINDLKSFNYEKEGYGLIKRRAGSLYRIFPRSFTNALCQDLLKINYNFYEILDQFKCELEKKQPSTKLYVTSNVDNIEEIGILLPNKNTFYYSIKNYTIDVKYEVNTKKIPEIHISIESVKTEKLIQKLRMFIYTNFHDHSKNVDDIKAGPGMREMNQRDNQLFHIRTDVLANREAPDKKIYPICIVFEIPIGVPVIRNSIMEKINGTF